MQRAEYLCRIRQSETCSALCWTKKEKTAENGEKMLKKQDKNGQENKGRRFRRKKQQGGWCLCEKKKSMENKEKNR